MPSWAELENLSVCAHIWGGEGGGERERREKEKRERGKIKYKYLIHIEIIFQTNLPLSWK